MKDFFSTKKRQTLIAILGVLSILLITLGVSYSFFNYSRTGVKENSIELGSITFKYTENENLGNGISIEEAMPISDELGKTQLGTGKVFDFKVESSLSRSDLEYEIVAEPTENSTLPLDAIKFYMTEITSGSEVELKSTLDEDGNVKTLDTFSDTLIEIADGKTIYQETILKNTKGYTKEFRVRMWLREDLNWTDEKYNGKSGAIKINVYANSDRSMASGDTTSTVDTSVERVVANNKYLFVENTDTATEEKEYQYSVTVPNEVDTLDIDVIPSNMDATVEIEKLEEGYAYLGKSTVMPLSSTVDQIQSAIKKMTLSTGDNFFKATVTSSDKTKREVYILKVTREKSASTSLKGIIVGDYSLVPAYSDNINEYKITVPYEITSLNVQAESSEAVQTITGNGNIELKVGTNEKEIVVTAENGTERKIKITITREKSNDVSINNIGIEGYNLTLSEDGYYYTEVPYNVESVTLINKSTTNAVVSNAGEKLNLQLGNNDFIVTVTSQSGLAQQKYTVRIVRLRDTDNTLKSLAVTDHTIAPVFNKDVLLYTLTVENSVTSLEVKAATTSEVATYEVSGNTDLKVGENTVLVMVTAQNGTERTYTITVTRKASSDATLKSLSVNGYSISPKFESSEIAYTVTVPYTVTSLEVNAEVNNSEASFTVSGNQDFIVGNNNKINVEVTAGNGTKKTYTITVTRSQDTVNTLSGLSLTNCTLSPAFASEVTEYTCTVENDITATTVTATPTSSNANVVVNGDSGFKVGENTVSINVTAQNGSVKIYTVKVTRKASSDSTLKSLGVTGYTISPTFNSGTIAYTVSVPYSVTSLEVKAEVNNNEASYDVSGNKDFKVGENTINVVVTAGNKTTTTYTITVIREKDTDNTLKSLNLTSCTLSPTFASGTISYACTVENSVTSTTVSATANSSVATVSGTGNKSLSVGPNTVNVVVTSQSGSEKTYTVVVTRKASGDATLKSLSVSSGTLSPEFESSEIAYTLSVPYTVTSLEVNAEVNNSEASLTGTGTKDLVVGKNTVEVKVTAGNGTTKTYTITITREKDTVNTLSSLSLTNCTLSPAFASGTTSYTCTVENNITSTTVTATPTSSNASVVVNGDSGFKVGENTVSINVTAQNGGVKIYTVKVTRKASSDATLKALSVLGHTISPTFSSSTTAYTVSVPYSVTSLEVSATVNNSEASYVVSGNTGFEVGTNDVTVKVTAGNGATETYTITVTREKDTDNTLKSLSLTNCTLSPTFASGTTSYACTVENSVTSTTVSATANSSVAAVSGTGSKTLNVGSNTVTVDVTSQSGVKKTYTVTVTRKASSDATLKSITVTDGSGKSYSLSPTFASATTAYSVTVPYSVTSLDIIGLPTSGEATVEGSGPTTTLQVGTNTHKLVVTAGNGAEKTYTVTITRSQDTINTLSGLSLTNCTLSPTFASGTTSYTCTVENNITSTTVSAITTSSVATVAVTGDSGFKVGENTVSVNVTSQSGSVKTYTIKVTRKASSDATLSALSVSGYTISPTFASGTTAYTVSVPYSVTSLTVNATVNNSEASHKVNGNTGLKVGENEVTVVVTAGNGTTKTYTITVTREKDTTATLSALSLTGCTLSPTFASGTTSYSCSVVNSVTSTTVSATATSSVATVSGTGSRSLNVGENTISVKVTAQDGTSTKTYTVKVTRAASSDATLKGLTISSGTLSPTFASGTTSYTATVAYGVTSLTVTPTVNNSEASYNVSGNTSLVVGENTVTVKVTAGDGTTKTYTITVTRSKDTTNTLSSLSLTGCTLNPAFASGTTAYTCAVGNSVTSTTVSATATSSVATVSGAGNKTLAVGKNEIDITVTSQSGSIKTYTVTVTRASSSDATLSGLSVSGYTISPTFASGTTSYTLTVPYSVTSVTINATANNSEASVTGTGSKSLSVGSNTASVKVIAGDGTTKTYTITITRSQDTDNTLKSLSLTNCTLSPAFASGTTSYSCSVANSVTSTTVSATANSGVATVEGTGSQTLSVGSNTINVKVTAQNGTAKTYTITVTRAKNSDATLKSLGVTGYTLSPTFASGTTAYTVSVPYSTDSVTVTASTTQSTSSVEGTGSKTLTVGANTATVKVTAQDGTTKTYTITITRLEDNDTSLKSIGVTGYSIVKVDNNHYTLSVANSVTSVTVTATANSGVASVSGTGSKTLSVGANTVKVTVTAQDGTISVYEIVITRAASSDATLKSLSVSGYSISPSFSASTLSYTLTVPYSVSSVTINATVNNSEASVTGTGSKSLSVGSNTASVVVKAGDGTTKTYTITITRSQDTTATLSALSLTNCTLSPTFASGTTSYTCTVANSVSSTTVSATATSSVATVSGTGSKSLSVGDNTVSVTVKAQSGAEKTYTVKVHRKSNDATLSSLSVSGYTISPTFASGTTSYSLTVPNATSSITVNASANSSLASVTGTGSKSLSTGNNTVTVKVTAEDGTEKSYTITVKRMYAETITLSAKSATYTGSAIAANSATTASGLSVTYTYYNGTSCSGTALSGAPTNVGDYSVKATTAGNSNYEAGSKCVTHTITQAANTLSVSAKSGLTYNGSGQALVSASSAQGSVYYAVGTELTSSNYSSSGSTTVPTRTDAGTYKVYYYTPGNANYSAKSGNVSVTINLATLSGGSVKITGNSIYGDTLTATITNTSPTATYTYQWWTSTSATATTGTAISGATSQTYKPTSVAFGKYVGVTVTATKANYETKTFYDITDAATNNTGTIAARKVTVTASSASKTYDGTALTNSGCTASNMAFSHTITSCTMTSDSTITNAGSVANKISSVTASAGNSWYEFVYVDGTLTVNKKSVPVSWGSTTSFTYNGSGQAPTASVSTGISAETMTVTRTTGTNVGSYTSTASCSSVSGGQKSCNNYTLTSTTKAFSITQATNTLSVSAKTGLTYNGSAQSLVSASSAQGNVYYAVGTSLTSSNYSSSGSTTIPSKTDAGTYTVYYYTPGNTNYSAKSGSVSVTINKKSVAVSWGSTTSFTYNGSGQAPTASVSTGISAETMTVTRTTQTTVGSYTSTASCSSVSGGQASCSNYTLTSTTKSFTITQATNTLKVTAKSGLSYTGSAQSLVSASSAQGSVYYAVGTSLTSSNYSSSGSTSVPTKTDAGTYTVYYYTPGNTNYKAASGNVSVTISKIANTLSVSAKSGLTYSGSAQSLVSASSAQGSVYYAVGTSLTSSNYSSSGSTTIPTKTDAGTYTVYYYTPGNTNYNAKSGNVSVTIAKKADTLSITAVSKTYTGSSFSASFSATSGTTVTPTYYSDASCSTKTTTSNAASAGGAPKTVGTYYAKATSAGNSNYSAGSLSCTKAVTISKATNTLSVVARSGLTYNGSSQTLVGVSSTQGTVYYSTSTSLTSSNYSSSGSTTVSAGTNAGSYTVYYYTPGNTNYNEKSGSVSVTIAKKSVAVSWGSTTSFAYNGSAQAPTASVSTGISAETMTVTRTTATNAGSHTSTASCSSVSGGQKSCNNYTLTSTTKSFTITQIDNTLSVSAKSLTYTGSAQTLATASSAQGTVYYSTSTSLTSSNYSSGSTTIPTGTNAGSYTVYYYTPGNTNYKAKSGSVSVTIAKKSVAVSWGSTTSFAYNGSGQAPTASVSTGISAETMTVTRTTATNAGSHTSTASCSSVSGGQKSCSNYTLTSTTKAFTITQIDNTLSVSAKSLTYTGSAQTLVNVSSAQGTVYYNTNSSLTSSNYQQAGSTTIPTKTDAGTYTVYYYTPGNTNYKAKSGSVSVTIAKKADTVTLTAKSTTYTGSAISANTASATSGSQIIYSYYSTTDCSGTSSSGAPTNVGNYSVKAASTGNSNYSAGSKCVTHTITKGTPTISLTAKTATATGSAIAANTATAKNPNGTSVTLSYTYTYYTNSSCSSGATTTAPTAPGTYYVKAVSTATSNLVSASSSCTKHTINADTNANLSALSVSGYSISPAFNESTLSYTLTVEASSITINATKASNVASLSGTGTKTLSWGPNTFNISVTAQSGKIQVYTINVTNQKPSAPKYATASSSTNWISGAHDLRLSSAGSAISGVKQYEYKVVPSLPPGDLVTLKDGSEWFVVSLSDTEDTVTLLSKYNIVPSTGAFNSNCVGTINACNPVAFDSDGTTTYNENDSNNIGYIVKNKFLPYIKSSLGDNNITARIPTLDEVLEIQSHGGYYYAYSSLNSTNYWTSTVYSGKNIHTVTVIDGFNNGAYTSYSANTSNQLGLNPVITVNKSHITKVNGSDSKVTSGTISSSLSMGAYQYQGRINVSFRTLSNNGNYSDWTSPLVLYFDGVPPISEFGSVEEDSGGYYFAASDNTGLMSYGISSSSSTKPTTWIEFDDAPVREPAETYIDSSIIKSGTNYLWVKDVAGNTAQILGSFTTGPNFADTILANNTVKEGGTLTTASTSTAGLYRTNKTDSGNYTYFFRGNVTNNYVSFAGKTWRIVRINEDGSVRIILNSSIGANTYNSSSSSYSNTYYQNSTVKTTLTNWYNSNLSSYSSKIVSNTFCQKAAVAYPGVSLSFGKVTLKELTAYNDLSFKCSNDANGYGKITATIGLVNFDEAVYSGTYYGNMGTTYLPTTITMSPSSSNTIWSKLYQLTNNLISSSTSEVAPVINLSSSVTVTGSGTSSSPYVVQ